MNTIILAALATMVVGCLVSITSSLIQIANILWDILKELKKK